MLTYQSQFTDFPMFIGSIATAIGFVIMSLNVNKETPIHSAIDGVKNVMFATSDSAESYGSYEVREIRNPIVFFFCSILGLESFLALCVQCLLLE